MCKLATWTYYFRNGIDLVGVVARIDVFSGFHPLDQLDVRIAQPNVLSRHLIVHRPPEINGV